MKTLQEANVADVKEAEIPMFINIKDGHGFDNKVANLNHPCWCANTGIVKVEAIKVSSRNNKNVGIKTANDKATGAIFGIAVNVDRITKDIIWEKITLKEFEFFDLSKRKERQRYIVLSRHYTFEGSPNQFGKPQWRVIDQEKKANNYLLERSEKKRAAETAETLSYEQLVELAPAFGIRPEAHSQAMLTSEILKIADNDHKKFLTIWDSPDRKGMIVFKKAIKNGLITFEPTYGYRYEGQVLGKTEAQAYNYLTHNLPLLSAIDLLAKEKEKSSASYNPIVPATVIDPLEEYKKKIEEQEKELAALRAQKNDAGIETSELDSLKEEAKKLNIRGFALMKAEKLREEIEKAKQ